MESNISRDHLAMEAMKTLIQVSVRDSSPIIWRIKRWFGASDSRTSAVKPNVVAKLAYEYADAMIAEREKNKEE